MRALTLINLLMILSFCLKGNHRWDMLILSRDPTWISDFLAPCLICTSPLDIEVSHLLEKH